ncbi:putative Mg/Co/Ni transporter MgtE [Vibrio nigripulchritudo SFn27]|uniref:Magnesium transporter MgtE n=1 Tax=Vibrio nigripulchritudo TaxID=28173 RepID=U4K140_9VIBR|nr:magnesium transporter [Vibrio nigripulchritudo]CCN84820.1 putative Mg/Co/Ni transporter MgtE [Vibrio nigripulchritudo BLFn1]CCN87687.1 putative Mg/Co/Ni transporter MgtE [Vibrio nigripulchritudo SFn27]CCN95817.1 putative Mg/Co/Ni transporter MgtE [Vibrio nigripulchritudo ENn2]CCO38975.1 putative Mg/Co/Ni transporter MgtE [Vibrio nigripulchritudo SFn135]CCO51934.1 putative Mg/Co/Ni transporter MgtE [Vibrio nigripulchritudo Wn13]
MAEQLEIDQTHQTLQEVSDALDSGRFVHVRRMLQDMEPEDIAHLLQASPRKSRDVLWQLTDPEDYGEILDELSEDVKDSLVSKMAPERLAEATEGLETDDVAYVLRSLPDDVSREVLSQMDAADRHRIETALSYDEDTAGSLMSTDVITIRSDVDVDVVLRYLRMKGELPEATDALYVIDDYNKLAGYLHLTTLLTSQPDVQISEIMEDADEAISVNASDSDVASLFERRNWVSAPVVDEDNQLVGRITIDDVVDVIREDAEHSMMSMAGLDDEEDTFAPVVKSARKRSIWLGANVLAALTAASVSNLFEATLQQMAAIAVLMTIVPSMGGVAGNQTVALVIRGLALGHIGDTNKRELLLKEAAIGFLNGLLWALIIGGIVVVWKDDWLLGGVISAAMMTNLLVAGVAGVSIPIFLKKMNIDPALAGGMALTTVTDVVGLMVFLGLATLFIV